MRCTWLAKLATMMRFWAFANTVRRTLEMSLLRRHEAGDLGVRGVGEEEVDALLAEACERVQVGETAVQRKLVHLEVTGGHGHARVRMATASASGIEWLTAMNSQSKTPMRSRCPSCTSRV